jgi:site-specific DNA-methyltransferase (adenine-specific)
LSAAHLRSRFVRFLVSLRKSTHHANRSVYAFVPDVSLNCAWADEKLDKRYGLNEDEIAFLESMIRPMPAGATDADREASDE